MIREKRAYIGRNTKPHRPALFLILLALCFIPSILAYDYKWEKVVPEGPNAKFYFAMDYDNRRHRIVLFGGLDPTSRNETWEFYDNNWHFIDTETKPRPVGYHAMVYDAARQCMVLFGGYSNEYGGDRNETWTYDGEDWIQQFPERKPYPRHRHAMAYDPLREKIVVYGGEFLWWGLNRTYYQDTWEWDGENWTQLFPAHNPDGPIAAKMVYHNTRQTCVWVNRLTTWEWNGIDWSEIEVEPISPTRSHYDVEYCPLNDAIILFGGDQFSDTWFFDGTDWFEIFPDYQMEARQFHKMTYDPDTEKVILYSGVEYPSDDAGNMFSWDGTDWTPVIDPVRPPACDGPALAGGIDEIGVIMFGGTRGAHKELDETWRFRGGIWTQLFPDVSPPARQWHYMAGNYNRNQVILFGGEDTDIYFFDTWVWDGENWIEQFPSAFPPSPAFSAMVYDGCRDEVVLFGGGRSVVSNDTWVWGESDWFLRNPSTRPPGRAGHGMAYDENREKVVMYGGFDGTKDLSGTWEWDGDNWTEIITNPEPANREDNMFYMTYDRREAKVVLFSVDYPVETWSWDGSSWEQLDSPIDLSACRTRGFAYSSELGKTIVFGGNNQGINSNTWAGGFIEIPDTPTPVQTSTPTGTPTPDCEQTGVTIQMPSHYFRAGDMCNCLVTVCNATETAISGHPLFVTLDVFGTFYFAPSFTVSLDNYLDAYPEFPPGETEIAVIETFTWPENAGAANGLYFYAALTDPSVTDIFGEWDSWEFGWSE